MSDLPRDPEPTEAELRGAFKAAWNELKAADPERARLWLTGATLSIAGYARSLRKMATEAGRSVSV